MTQARAQPSGLAPRRLWALNLDAELELERAGRAYQTPARVAQALLPMLPRARALLAPGDLCLAEAGAGSGPEALLDARGEPATLAAHEPAPRGMAWCPSASARRRLERAGAVLGACPSLEVLRQVNHRRFYLELGGGAPGARYVEHEAELAALLREPRAWLCKRPFGFAGRGQRRVPALPSADDRRWLSDALRLGGFLAEPWLELGLELALHGLLAPDGQLQLGQVCVQDTDRFRAWVATRLATERDITRERASALRARAEAIAAALTVAGYFGPFGIDAYLFREPSGAIRLNTLGELNARFSMGFPVGLPRALEP